MGYVMESERLYFRKLTMDDFGNLKPILADIQVMYAWEHAFTDAQVTEWINKNLQRYATDGYSYFATIEKATGEFVGVIGPLLEDTDGEKQVGIGYILDKRYWGMGYATEGAKACVDHAFQVLLAQKVIAQIRPENLPSLRVAQRLGMQPEGQFIKYYRGKPMPHLIYSISR